MLLLSLMYTSRNEPDPTTHAKEKEENRKMFLKILSSIRYLARQGLPLRGDGDEQDGNFLQLLKLKGEDDPRSKISTSHIKPE